MTRLAMPMAMLTVVLFSMTALMPGTALALSHDGEATVEAGGHLVLMNFTVTAVPSMHYYDEASSIRYLVHMLEGSEQESYDVLLMSLVDYEHYLGGGTFQWVPEASVLQAGTVPAYAYFIFLEEGDYVLLVDNSDRGSAPSAAGEMKVRYEVVAENLEVHSEPRWDLFIALMVLIIIFGAAFLLILRVATHRMLERADEELDLKCAGCGERVPAYARFCPYCGRQR